MTVSFQVDIHDVFGGVQIFTSMVERWFCAYVLIEGDHRHECIVPCRRLLIYSRAGHGVPTPSGGLSGDYLLSRNVS